MLPVRALLLTLSMLLAYTAAAEHITVAVASNFTSPMRALVSIFEYQTGQRITLVTGSTGRHYAQILNGAPFDVFFAADSLHPARLENDGLAVADSRFTYAQGRLVLWSPMPGYVDSRGEILTSGRFEHLAIANPKLAPYGSAAQKVLEQLHLWQSLQPQLVRGENISQAFQFVKTGAAELGFVALSQIALSRIQQPGRAVTGSYWLVPQNLHAPIAQQAVILKPSATASAFMDFVRSPAATEILHSYGYTQSEVDNDRR